MTALVNVRFRYLSAVRVAAFDSATTSNNNLTIFKGTMPTNLVDWVRADSSADELVNFSNFSLIATNERAYFGTAPSPSIVNATASGTAAWYAFTNDAGLTKYFFGEVTENTGAGSLHLVSTTCTLGQPVEIENFSIAFNSV